ncbi:hypothetical protein cyc_00469 [Cyclospora cayetanensis]|nr:hypothetical protein cyc_00469 [Cyclospora cayetanensis]
MLDGPLMDAELARLEDRSRPFAHMKAVQQQLESVRRLFDLMRIVEDVRDHLNEIMELGSRSSGIGGTGLCASPSVDNVSEHAAAATETYDRLMKQYPEFCAKTEEALGRGLALLRQKHKFHFSAEHRFFF